MTPDTRNAVFTNEAFAALGAPSLVYVRPIKAVEVIDDAEPDMQERLDPEQTLYSVHRADGARLAVLTDKESAMAAALAHELAPVMVH